jgi:Dullard-like phosphatase family protein
MCVVFDALARHTVKPACASLYEDDRHAGDPETPQDTVCASTSAAAAAEAEPDTSSSQLQVLPAWTDGSTPAAGSDLASVQECLPAVYLLQRPLPATKRGTLVLDMDKTLIFKEWRLQPIDKRPQVVYRPDFHFGITYRGYPVQYHVKKRPFLDEFLRHAAALFDVVLFTASESIVTLPVVRQLDPEGKLIHHLLCRNACTERGGLYVKDLARLGRDLSRTVIIDDNPDSFIWQPDNAILVGEFSGWEDHDRELLRLMPILDLLAASHDMRAVIAALVRASAPLHAMPGPGTPGGGGYGGAQGAPEQRLEDEGDGVQEEDSETSVVYL